MLISWLQTGISSALEFDGFLLDNIQYILYNKEDHQGEDIIGLVWGIHHLKSMFSAFRSDIRICYIHKSVMYLP